MAYQFARKLAIVFIIALFLGAQIGRQVRAETRSVWVDPVGTVGTASTTGFPSQGSIGSSSSSVTLYWLRAYTKIWHAGPILQNYHDAWNTNTRFVQTRRLMSSGYGDYAVTRHEFIYVPSKPKSVTYTSDNGARSCFQAWDTYVQRC